MAVNVFEQLLIEKIDNFKSAFINTSEGAFLDENGVLIHPGEFGRYRENVCKEFLKFVIPSRLDIGQGFIINTFNNISPQCDIVIYDSKSTPLLESSERQVFYPVESVVSVGEIKSVLTKATFKDAINKLARVKKLREQVKHPTIIKKEKGEIYNPKEDWYDQLFTFIVCKKLDFDISNLSSEINSMYDASLEYRQRHNLILSIDDGLLAYYDANNKTMMYPKWRGANLKNRFIYPDSNKYVHFKYFASYLFLGTTSATVLYPEFTDYMGNTRGGMQISEK